MIGAPAGFAVVLAVIAVTLHRHNRKKRAFATMIGVSVLLTAAAFLAVLAVTPSLGPVWAYTGNGPGLVVLLGVVAASGITYYHHLRYREHFHAHATPVTGVLLAVSAALAVLNIRHVSAHAIGAVAGSWRGTGTAFTRLNSGKSASAAPVTVTSGSHGVILAIGIAIVLLVLVKAARSYGGRHKGGSAAGAVNARTRELGK